MPLINPTQGLGLCFGSTLLKGINVSARSVGYGQALVADSFKIDADSTSVTPNIVGSAWRNWKDLPAEAATNLRRAPKPVVGIVMDQVTGGIPDNGEVTILVQGYPLVWVRRTAANAGAAIYDAIGSPLALDLNTTNVVRVLSSGIGVITAAGLQGPMKCVALCETLITSTATAVDVAEGAGPFPMLPTGPAGTLYATALYGTANGIMLADVLFDGVNGL